MSAFLAPMTTGPLLILLVATVLSATIIWASVKMAVNMQPSVVSVPTRSYDADTGVTCYSIPGAISCVRATEP